MTEYMRKARRFALTALVVAAPPIALVGCGSSSGSSSSTSASSAAPASSSTTASTAAASSAIDPTKVYAQGVPTLSQLTGKGSEAPPPATSPPPAKGKSVWWVSCGMVAPPCSRVANAAKEAAGHLGIQFHIADGNLNIGGGNATALRTALAAHPDAIFVHGISCPAIQQPLQEAKALKIPVMGVEALDCSETGGPQLLSGPMKYTVSADSGTAYFNEWGKSGADAIIDLTGGKASVMNLTGPEPLYVAINKGFKDELSKCALCKIIGGFNFNSSDETPNGPYVQMLRAAVLKYPATNAVFTPVDPAAQFGAPVISKALPHAVNVGGSGEIDNIDLIRKGVQTAATGAHDATWMGWAAMDNMNRILNGQPTVAEGVGFKVLTKDNIPAAPGSPYVSPINYKAAYLKAWGVQ